LGIKFLYLRIMCELLSKEKINAILIISGKRTLDKRKMIVYNANISNCK